MTTTPYSEDGLAMARHVVTHPANLTCLDPADRDELIRLAWVILQGDRSARHPDTAAPQGPALILRIPLTVFQAGPARKHRAPAKPQIITFPITTTPGDAA